MSEQYVSVNIAKLRAMKTDWEGIVLDRGRSMVAMRERLIKLEKVEVAQVLEFYNAILSFGKAGGHVEMLEALCEDLSNLKHEPDTNEPNGKDFRL